MPFLAGISPLVGAALIGGGGLLGSSLLSEFGPSGQQQREASGAQADAARLQAEIAAQLFAQSQPLRDPLFGTPGNLDLPQGLGGPVGPDFALPTPGQLPAFVETGALPPALQVPFASVRDSLEDQFGVARENVLSRVPARGGDLNALLTDIETGRARAIGQIPLLELPVRENLFRQTLGIASGAPVQAVGGLGSAATAFQGLANEAILQQQAIGQSFGDVASLAAKAALKGGGTGRPTPGLPPNPMFPASGAPYQTQNPFGNLPVWGEFGP